jgi:hypothetical protein
VGKVPSQRLRSSRDRFSWDFLGGRCFAIEDWATQGTHCSLLALCARNVFRKCKVLQNGLRTPYRPQ